MSKIIIAIDGPAASGKSTAAKYLAEKQGYVYLDTGAMYRAITYLALRNKIVDDVEAVIEMTKNINIDLKFENGITRVFVNSEEVTDKIRTREVNAKVSEISKIPEVRVQMVKIQRQMSARGSLVAEGRDITTVVFPNADIKIFMTADIDVRAQRRLKEFQEKGINTTFEEVKENLNMRDKLDSGRKVSPLTKAKDAFELDTTHLSVQEEINRILDLIKIIEEEKAIPNN